MSKTCLQGAKPVLKAAFLCWLVLFAFVTPAWAVCSTTGTCVYVGVGQSVPVQPTAFANPTPACEQVSNNGCPLTIMVPDGTQAEWGSFVANHESCVSFGTCTNTPSVSLTANPTTINSGDASTLTWTVTNNATSCTASGDASFNGSVTPSGGTAAVSPTTTTTYSLSCVNSAGTGTASVVVTVGGDGACPSILGPSSAAQGQYSSVTIYTEGPTTDQNTDLALAGILDTCASGTPVDITQYTTITASVGNGAGLVDRQWACQGLNGGGTALCGIVSMCAVGSDLGSCR